MFPFAGRAALLVQRTSRPRWLGVRRGWPVLPILLCLVLSSTLPVRAADAQPDATTAVRARTLVIGKISTRPQRQIPRLLALGRRLAGELRSAGIETSAAVVARNADEMAALLRTGQVDIVSETLFSALRLVRDAGAEILLREWKSGVPTYRTLFVTRKDSSIAAPEDLVGRRIAFESEESTSGYAVPLLSLRAAGLRLVEAGVAGGRSEKPVPGHPNVVEYIFAGSQEINILAWILRGHADAGVLSDQEWRDPTEAPQSFKQRLRVFHRTAPIVRSLLLVRGDLDPALKAKIKESLLAIHRSPDGAAALETYFGVAKYDELPGEALRDLDRVRRLLASGT